MPKYQCPECEAVLRRAEAIAPGKKIRCPKCEAVFPANPLPDDEPAPEQAAGYALAGAPAPKPKPVEEEENSNPYRVIKGGSTAPKVVSVTPNNSIPRQAEVNTAR